MSLGDPGVQIKVVDLSTYIDEMQKGWIIVMGQSERGEPWVPGYFENGEKFIKYRGNSVDWSRDPLSTLNMLANKGKVIHIRIVHCDDPTDPSTTDTVSASALIPDRGGQPTAGYVQSAAGPFTFQQARSGRVTGAELGPFTITEGANDQFKMRLGISGAWGAEQTVTLTAGTARTAQQVCDDINAGTNGLNATISNNRVYAEGISPQNSLEILAATNDAYSTLGFNVGVNARVVGTDSLIAEVDGAGDQPFTLVPAHGESGQFTLTSSEIATQLSGMVGASIQGLYGVVKITSSTTGPDSSVQVKGESTAATALGFDTDPHFGAAGVVKYPWKATLRGPGAYGNAAKIYFYQTPLRKTEAMNVRIVIPGTKEEYFGDLTRTTDSPTYWKNYINTHSEFITITDTADDPNPDPYDWPALNSNGITFADGDDGGCVLTDADWVGDPAAKTGVWSVLKSALPAIDVMAIGTSSIVAHIELAAWMGNQIGLMGHGQLPEHMSPEALVALRMGEPPYSHAALDSCNYSLIHGWPQIFDVRNNGQVPVPALSYLGSAITKNDEDYGVSWAPFGVKRGNCEGVLGLEFNVGEDPAAADLFADYQINDLRILRHTVKTTGWEGAKLWGNYTSQRAASTFREFNDVRLIKTYERALYPVLLGYVFDPNHPVTWAEIDRVLQPYFRNELRKYAIYGFFIQTDKEAYFAGGELKGAVLNTGLDIDQGKYRCRILLQPTKVIRYLQCEMGVTRTGQPFADYAELYQLPGYVRRV
jgi:hypothetical protein